MPQHHHLTRRGLLALGGAGALVASAPAAYAAGGLRPLPAWPSVGRDEANTRAVGVQGTTIGAHDVADLSPLWRLEDLGGCTSVPAVVDGTVYVGAWDGTVRAVDARTGRKVWTTPIGAFSPLLGFVTPVNASPAVAGGRVVVGTMDGHVHALEARTGRRLWKWLSQDNPTAAIWSSAVVVGRHVFVGTGSTDVVGWSDPPISRGSVVCLDLYTGREVWRWWATGADAGSGAGVSIWSSPAVDLWRGLLFVGTGQNVSPPAGPYSDALVCLDLRTGRRVWHRQYTTGDVFRIFPNLGPGPDFDIGASPNLFRAGGRDVVGVADKGGVYAVFERGTGAPVWARRLTPGSHLGGVMQTAAIGPDTVYVASNTMVDPNAAQAPGNVSSVFALDSSTGDVRWRAELPACGWGAVTLARDALLVPTVTGGLYALHARTGEVLTRLLPSGSAPAGTTVLGSGPSVSGGLLLSGWGVQFFGPSLRGGLTAFARHGTLRG